MWLWLFSNCLPLILVPFSLCRWVSNCWRHLASCLENLCFRKFCKYLSLKKSWQQLPSCLFFITSRLYFSRMFCFPPVTFPSSFICFSLELRVSHVGHKNRHDLLFILYPLHRLERLRVPTGHTHARPDVLSGSSKTKEIGQSCNTSELFSKRAYFESLPGHWISWDFSWLS
jgi:hypothetical protein